MTTFKCELIDDMGIVHERFWREALSEDDLLEGLNLFQWHAPKDAKWRVYDAVYEHTGVLLDEDFAEDG